MMFEDDTNLFFSRQNLKKLFQNASSQLNKIFTWLNADILSFNKDSTKYAPFYKAQQI